MSFCSGKDSKSMIKFLIDVAIYQAAAKIIDINETEVVCGRFEQLHVSVKLKHSSTYCDVSLRYYGLSAPEGSLAQRVCDEQKENALAASFVQSPVGENVDWRLSATMCPVHVAEGWHDNRPNSFTVVEQQWCASILYPRPDR